MSKELVKEIRNQLRVYEATENGNCQQAKIMAQAADTIEKLTSELSTCRNELCLYCGQYKQSHLGACDGCRWKKV